MKNLWKIIIGIQLLSPLFRFTTAGSVSLGNANCIRVPLVNNTAKDVKPICDFLLGKGTTGGRVLLVFKDSAVNQERDDLMRVVNKHYSLQILTFDLKTVLKAKRQWTEPIDALIFDPILCKTNSKVREFIEAFPGRTFELVVAKLITSNKFQNKLIGNLVHNLSICRIGCSGEPASIKLSLAIAARKFEPFTIADNGSTFNRGIEILLIESIVQKMNVERHYDTVNSSHQGNENAIIMGGWPIGHRNGLAPNYYPSVTYDYDSTVWCVRRAGLIPTWKNIFKIFKDRELFYGVNVIFYIIVLIIYKWGQYQDLDWDYMRISLASLSVTLSISVVVPLRGNIAHKGHLSALICAFLYYLHFLCFYVVVINREYYQPQLDSWKEIQLENFQMAIDEQGADLLGNGEFSPDITNGFIICPNIDDCLAQLAENDHLAVAISQKHAMNNPVIPNWMIHCFEDPEHFYGYPVLMFIPRGHPLHSKINERIQWALEGGLINKWTAESRIKFKQPTPQHVGPVVLTNEHIFIGWMLFFLFGSFSCGAFIAEHIIHRMIRRPNPGRFWQIADMGVDGERHYWLPCHRQGRDV